jgi:hypothetical protein
MLLVTIFPLSTLEQKESPDSLTWAELPGTLGPESVWAVIRLTRVDQAQERY